jgi:AmmeMemoRadiSam system protein B/AmmeMemoRadiSam system protein A
MLFGCGKGRAGETTTLSASPPGGALTRPAAVAGTFYERDPKTLKGHVTELLREAPKTGAGRLRAAVVPHAGYVYSGSCAAAAYALLGTGSYDRVIVLAPSHTRGFRGIALPAASVARFATPLGETPLDREACDKLAELPGFGREPEVNSREHAVEVHLPFLQTALGSFKLIPLVCGSMGPAELDRASMALAPFMNDRTLLIASSDFTHYGEDFDFTPFTNRIRERLYDYLETASSAIAAQNRAAFRAHCDKTGDTICGRFPIDILLGVLDQKKDEKLIGRVLDKTTSGDLTGDFNHCVSYATIGFFSGAAAAGETTGTGKKKIVEHKGGEWSAGLSDAERATLFAIARDTLTWAVNKGRGEFDYTTYKLTPKLEKKTATFVTLKIGGRLRGCIGSLAPIAPLYQSVHDNAIQAAIHDPRFPPVAPFELARIEVDVSILSPMRDIPSWKDFKIGPHGIIMAKDGRRAVYLPEVAVEQGWSVEETLSSLSEKAGLPSDAWEDGAQFQVFESVVLAEE